jgi:AcrR family transcriptional regulator
MSPVRAATANDSDPRVRRTRGLLVRAFVDLLDERGFKAISVQEVAQRATVNRATFYAHFADKYELYDWTMREWFRDELARRLPPPEQCSPDDLPQLTQAVMEFLGAVQDHCGPVETREQPPIEGMVQEELQRFVQALLDGSSRGPEESRDITAAVLSWGIFGTGVSWARQSPRPPAEEVARKTAALLSRGLSMPRPA